MAYRRNIIDALLACILGSGGFDVLDTSRQELVNALLGRVMVAIEDLDADECLPSQAQIAKSGQLFSTVSQLGYRVFYSLAR